MPRVHAGGAVGFLHTVCHLVMYNARVQSRFTPIRKERKPMKTDEHPLKTEYRSPKIASAGDAAGLTFGNGTVYTDSLGDPSTRYGKYREAEAAEPVEPAYKGAPDKPKSRG